MTPLAPCAILNTLGWTRGIVTLGRWHKPLLHQKLDALPLGCRRARGGRFCFFRSGVRQIWRAGNAAEGIVGPPSDLFLYGLARSPDPSAGPGPRGLLDVPPPSWEPWQDGMVFKLGADPGMDGFQKKGGPRKAALARIAQAREGKEGPEDRSATCCVGADNHRHLTRRTR